jgi:hypothetical protein
MRSMLFRLFFGFLGLAGGILDCAAAEPPGETIAAAVAGPVTVTFDTFDDFPTSEWREGGFVVFSPDDFWPASPGSFGFFAANGTTCVIVPTYRGPLAIRHAEGHLFSLRSVDLAEYSTSFQSPQTITFVGTKGNGTTVRQSFVTDGIIDGTGPVADFQTFTFPAQFSGLVKVEVEQAGYAIDQIRMEVLPETIPNRAPEVSAGADQVITLPGTAGLVGMVTDDLLPVGSTVTLAWSQVSGPGVVSFKAATSRATEAVFPKAGSYVVRLTASDGAASASDEAQIVVRPAIEGAVVIDFEPPTLPNGAAGISKWEEAGLRFVAGDTIVHNALALGAGPSRSPHNGGSFLQFLSGQGLLSITAINGGIFSPVSVDLAEYSTVFPVPKTLTFTGTKPDGTTILQTFTTDGVIDGNGPKADFQTFDFRREFSGIVRLSVDTQIYSIDRLLVVPGGVLPPRNEPPSVLAGADQTLQWPAATVSLAGQAHDDTLPAGGTLRLTWSMVSGPGTAHFSASDQAATTVQFAQPGTYVLRLTADDGVLSAGDEVTVRVLPPRTPPVVNLGADRVVIAGEGALFRSVITDSVPAAAGGWRSRWSAVSGPAQPQISSPSTTFTYIQFPAPGYYVLALEITDGELTARDEITVTVVPGSGVYVGHLAVESGGIPRGLLQITVSSNGGFSAQLQLGSQSLPISGSFSVNGTWTGTVNDPGGATIPVRLELDAATGTVQAAITQGENTLVAAAVRAGMPHGSAAAVLGKRYTFNLVPGGMGAGAMRGHGYGFLRTLANGSVLATGTLPDGSPFSFSGLLTADGQAHFYQSLQRGRTTLAGSLRFAEKPMNDFTGEARWARASVSPGQTALPLPMSISGSALVLRDRASEWVTGATTPVPAQLIFGGENSPVGAQACVLKPGLRVSIAPPGAMQVYFSLKANGAFRGSFRHPHSSRVMKFSGAVLQKAAGGSGFFRTPEGSEWVALDAR